MRFWCKEEKKRHERSRVKENNQALLLRKQLQLTMQVRQGGWNCTNWHFWHTVGANLIRHWDQRSKDTKKHADCPCTSLSDSTRTWSYSLSATRNIMEVTFSKQWIHFLLSDLWPPTSTILALGRGQTIEEMRQKNINHLSLVVLQVTERTNKCCAKIKILKCFSFLPKFSYP